MTAKNDITTDGADKGTGSDLVPLSAVVDLAAPHGGALALQYSQGIERGDIPVWGVRGSEGSLAPHDAPLALIPAEEWVGLAIEWIAGNAVAKVSQQSAVLPVWERLHIPCASILVQPPEDGTETWANLAITFSDARAIAQWWRETDALPADWPWPPNEFWESRPEARPDWRETKTRMHEALEDGSFEAAVETAPRQAESFPASAWRATRDRACLTSGRVNLGTTTSQRIKAEGALREEAARRKLEANPQLPDQFDDALDAYRHWLQRLDRQVKHDWEMGEPIDLPPELHEQWHLAYLGLADLRCWVEATWSAPNNAGETITNNLPQPHANRSQKGRKPDPTWWEVMAAAGAWLEANGEPDTLAEVERFMAEQFVARSLPEPAASYLRERARHAIEGFRRYRSKADN